MDAESPLPPELVAVLDRLQKE